MRGEEEWDQAGRGWREPCCWVSWADVFWLRFGLLDHCLVHHSTLGTPGSSWSSCQHHLSQRNNGRGSADVQEVPWVRARLVKITLFLYTSWGFCHPRAILGPASHHHAAISLDREPGSRLRSSIASSPKH